MDLIALGQRWAPRALQDAQENRRPEVANLPTPTLPYVVLIKITAEAWPRHR
ncbi:MAG: hypothetical protein WAM30_13325 [Candidatus Dormiibacterota bacterium]